MQLISELQSHRTALVIASQGIDATDSNPVAQLQLNILGAVAQFDRDFITERVLFNATYLLQLFRWTTSRYGGVRYWFPEMTQGSPTTASSSGCLPK